MANGSGDSEATTPASLGRRGALLAGLSLLLGACVVVLVGSDIAGRSRVDRFVAQAGLQRRRPLEVQSLQLEPAADLAAAAAVEVALQGTDASDPRPQPWLATARKLLLVALIDRPGWPFHTHVLARLADREARIEGAGADPRRWMTAWRAAASGAPRSEAIHSNWAQACLRQWPSLPPAWRAEALEAIRAGFRDPEFLAGHVGEAAAVLGDEATIRLLPDRAEALRAAAAAMANRSLARATNLLESADRAEARDRRIALAGIEDLARRGERASLAEACRRFATAFPAERFDDAEGRRQTARLLELWPSEPGPWSTDPRASLVRFFLDGREGFAAPEGLRRALSSLPDAPEPVRAAVLLLTGDRAAAEKLHAARVVDQTKPDWVGYELRAAREALRRNDPSAARQALGNLPSYEMESCEALLLQRDTALASNDRGAADAFERRIEGARVEPSAIEDWIRTGRLTLCLDPASSSSLLVVRLRAAVPAVVAYGWDRGRDGTAVVAGERVLELPLGGRWGSRVFWFTPLVGGRVTPIDAAFR